MKNFIATLFVFLVSVSIVDAAQYLQASSTVTQCPGTAPDVVKMDITDAANGVTMANNKITVSEAGSLSDSRRAAGRARGRGTPWLF